jgi:hypothetical protein
MSSPALEALKAEITTAHDTITPQIEGLHDFARLNLKPETLTKVQNTIVEFERRRDLMEAALGGINNLSDDGYPEVPVREVIADVYNDLAENVSTIEAAFKKFAPIDEAMSATIVPGTPETKP